MIYTPTNTALVGEDTFTYLITTSRPSNVATVTVLTTQPPGGPTPIAPASFTLVGLVTGGTATVANGQVTYTAGGAAGSGSFQYTIASLAGVPSAPATVSLTILPAADTLDIVSAWFRTSTRRWDVTGTATVPRPDNVVTVVLVRHGSVIGTVGTAPVDTAGT